MSGTNSSTAVSISRLTMRATLAASSSGASSKSSSCTCMSILAAGCSRLIRLRAEDKPCGAFVYVFALLESVQHFRVVRDVGQQSQFQLRVVRRNQLITFFRHERAAYALAQLCADWNILKIRLR